MDCSPPGTGVHGILQARILEWVVIPFSRGSFQPTDRTNPGSPTMQADYLPSEPPGKPSYTPVKKNDNIINKLKSGLFFPLSLAAWDTCDCVPIVQMVQKEAGTRYNLENPGL